MTYVVCFRYGRKAVEVFAAQDFQFPLRIFLPGDDGVALPVVVYVDGEVAYAEGREVLEEVRAL